MISHTQPGNVGWPLGEGAWRGLAAFGGGGSVGYLMQYARSSYN